MLQHFEEKNEHLDNIGNKMKIIFKLTVNKNTSMTYFGSILIFYSYINNEYVGGKNPCNLSIKISKLKKIQTFLGYFILV